MNPHLIRELDIWLLKYLLCAFNINIARTKGVGVRSLF